jgi:hypothetical protein
MDDTHFVDQQKRPASGSGTPLPIGFFAVEEELLVEGPDRIPRVATNRQT